MSAHHSAGTIEPELDPKNLLRFPRRKLEPTVFLPTYNHPDDSICRFECANTTPGINTRGDDYLSSAKLERLSSEQRIDILRNLCAEFLHAEPETASLGSLPRLLRKATIEERVTLVDELVALRRNGAVSHLIAAILRESNDLDQLRQIVTSVGMQRLSNTRSPSVREFVAWATVAMRMRQVPIPSELSKYSGLRSVERVQNELQLACESAERVLDNAGKFSKSELAKQFKRIVSEIRDELAELVCCKISVRRQVNWINSLSKRMELGLHYALLLSSDRTRSWRSQDLEEIEQLFTKLPEGKILFTPRLFEIRRVEQDDDDTQGERHEDGLIRILDIAIDDRIQQLRNHGVSSLQSVVAHELGHALQLGASSYRMRFSRTQLQFVGMSDPSYDFEYYMRLSGWAIVAPQRYKIAYFGDAVIIDDQLVPLDRPLLYCGSPVEFRFDPDDEVLYAVNPFARYSLGSYATTNPWEDWAEAFCEYLILPERLAAIAAEKFEYFNDQFGLYGEDKSE